MADGIKDNLQHDIQVQPSDRKVVKDNLEKEKKLGDKPVAVIGTHTRVMTGRKVITSSVKKITRANVVDVVMKAYAVHQKNRDDINYLTNYYCGIQPILHKTKQVRPEINSVVRENRAQEIVDFKVGYSYGEPVQYVSKVSDEKVSKDVSTLNDYMDVQNRDSFDVELAKWQMVCGLGYKLALPALTGEESPFDVCIPDPRDTFIVYDNTVRHRPLVGVIYTEDPETASITFGAYADGMYYEIAGMEIVKSQPLYLPGIPLVEYPLNSERMGAFEPVLDLLDAINEVDSNRLDGIKQFIQSLAVAVNCQFKDGTTANDIRQAGMIVLKSVGENKADFKILSEQLNQTETQTLKNDMMDAVREIVGMPAQGNARTGDSSNNGAVILRNGWEAAEARAKAYDKLFRKSEMQFLKIVLAYCPDLHISRLQIKIQPTRSQYEDIYTKAQVLNLLLGNKYVHPKVAYAASNMFSDVENAYQMGIKWADEQEAKAAKQAEAEAKASETPKPAVETEPAKGADPE